MNNYDQQFHHDYFLRDRKSSHVIHVVLLIKLCTRFRRQIWCIDFD